MLTVKPNETTNLSVDYEKQVNKQINNYYHSDSLNNSQTNDEIVSVSFGKSNKAHIKEINLNKLGLAAEKHFFGDPRLKEFILYEVSF